MGKTHDKSYPRMNRRIFFKNTGLAGAGAAFTAAALNGQNNCRAAESSPSELLRETLKYRKLDSHNHISPEDPAMIIASADMLGIEKIAISVPAGDTPGEFRASNDKVLAAMRRYPDRILGQCYVNPGYPRESQEEITRCIGEGMVQVGELYTQYRINEPVYYPIIERCIDLKIPLLMHALAILGLIREGYTTHQSENTSIADDFVEIGNRYPEAMIVHAHIFGGGDWEYTCKTLRDVPSIYGGTCGSQADEGMVDFGLKYLGEDRMIFGTDVNFETGVGKVLSANLTENQRQKIFFGNYNNMLRKAGNHVD
jgi:uncharacterized protein